MAGKIERKPKLCSLIYAERLFKKEFWRINLKPEDLKIPRFMGRGYSPKIFGTPDNPRDNVYKHTIRSISYLINLVALHPEVIENNSSCQVTAEEVLSMGVSALTRHDAEEKLTGDRVGPEKGLVGEGNPETERLAAHGLLSYPFCNWDFNVWEETAKTDQGLKTGEYTGHSQDFFYFVWPVILEKADGNLVQNHLVTQFLKVKGRNGLNSLPPDRTLTFAFRQINAFKTNLTQIPDVRETGILFQCNSILTSVALLIKEMWDEIDERLVPEVVRPYLAEINEQTPETDCRQIFGNYWQI